MTDPFLMIVSPSDARKIVQNIERDYKHDFSEVVLPNRPISVVEIRAILADSLNG